LEAIQELLAALRACLPPPPATQALRPDPATLLDLDCVQAQARRFKLDLSFELRADGQPRARFSVNDKGEPETFRTRLRGAELALPTAPLEGLLALAAPGHVQTTLGVKWGAAGGAPARVSVYLEELFGVPDAEQIRAGTFGLLGLRAPPPMAGLLPVSVCLDFAAGQVVAVKDYFMATERPGDPPVDLPPGLAAHRDRFPVHPVNGHRRYLVARRLDPDGRPTGSKLLWMSEVHRNETLSWAWAEVDRLRVELRLPPSPTAAALDALRTGWPHAPDTFLHPDLVSLNAGPDGEPDALLIYTSLR